MTSVYNYYTIERQVTLPAYQIFVFGSNLRGRHGMGAAFCAMCCYGAKNGIGEGLYGQSYALPTKDEKIKTLSLSDIAKHVEIFFEVAKSRQGSLEFFVTRIGCGLAGYSDAQIAPLFRGCPNNCIFHEDWRKYLE